ncbi:MAG: glycosyltransferase [Dorea sp.]
MIAFVILHYRAADMTRRCVEKIQALPGEKQIVIVDNASPNGSGQVLLDEYASCPEIKVILNPENSGFAKGNNLGVKWVREHKKPEFTVVLNNDVEILQEDFCKRIGEIYEKQPFDVLRTGYCICIFRDSPESEEYAWMYAGFCTEKAGKCRTYEESYPSAS